MPPRVKCLNLGQMPQFWLTKGTLCCTSLALMHYANSEWLSLQNVRFPATHSNDRQTDTGTGLMCFPEIVK